MASKKHYTDVEKCFFVEIIKKYAHIIEQKKSDSSSLKDKEEAWREINNSYNASSVISTKRNVTQLKKLWSNLKLIQRDLLTEERQNVLRTGGGPAVPSAEINPDIAAVVPNLMVFAPTLSTSNLLEEEMHERQEEILNATAEGNINIDSILENESEVHIPEPFMNFTSLNKNRENLKGTAKTKTKKCNCDNQELLELKIKKTKLSIENQQDLATIIYNHEKKKQEMEIEFLKKKYELELEKTTSSK